MVLARAKRKWPGVAKSTQEWVCSCCGTHNKPNPYCKKCWPEENKKWGEAHPAQ